MAGEILKGEDVMTMPVRVVKDSFPVYNSEIMSKFKLQLAIPFPPLNS